MKISFPSMTLTRKKTRSQQARLVIERLLRDEEVQGQLRTAATRLQEAGARVRSRRGAEEAVEDKKVYAKIREAATSLTKAQRSLRAEPEPPAHRGRKLVVLTAAGGAAAWVVVKKRKSSDDAPVQSLQVNGQSVGPAEPQVVPLGA